MGFKIKKGYIVFGIGFLFGILIHLFSKYLLSAGGSSIRISMYLEWPTRFIIRTINSIFSTIINLIAGPNSDLITNVFPKIIWPILTAMMSGALYGIAFYLIYEFYCLIKKDF